MTDRLKAIEDRARGLGWEFIVHDNVGMIFFDKDDFEIIIDGKCALLTRDNNLQAAERLLSLYEDGAMVEIGPPNETGRCLTSNCPFWGASVAGDCGSTFSPEPYSSYIGCRLKLAIRDSPSNYAEPGPDCPGAGKYKLVRWEDA